MSTGIEIERKYLIALPDLKALAPRCSHIYEMQQTYLLSQPGVTSRVRLRREGEHTEYIRTSKRRLSSMSAREQEESISQEEYRELLKTALPDRQSIHKYRYCLPYQGHVFEIDVYDFWKDVATMEVELSREEEEFSLPEGVVVLAELTGDYRFSNASLAKEVPDLSAYRKGENHG